MAQPNCQLIIRPKANAGVLLLALVEKGCINREIVDIFPLESLGILIRDNDIEFQG